MSARPRALTRAELKRFPLPPVEEADKNAHGRLLLIAGSRETPGSAAIAATAALRSGCGKVTLATVESAAPHVALAVPEARVLHLPQARDGGFARSAVKAIEKVAGDHDAVVAGPGMLENPVCSLMAAKLLTLGLRRLVLDAAMLHALPPHDDEARDSAMPILLPNDEEMQSLVGIDPDGSNALQCGLACAARYGALTLVKGPKSHVVTPDGRSWRYSGGGPGLGISGSGDSLAGVLGGLLARGADPLTALLWAVWLHGEAGAALTKKVGLVGFLAREIPAEVPALLAR